MVNESPFMTLKEAAEFLRYSTSSLYKRQDIPRHKLPGSKDWRYDRAELVAWAKSTVPDRLTHQKQPTLSSTPEPSSGTGVSSTEPQTVTRRRSSRYC